MRIISAEAEAVLDWIALTRAIEAGHRLPKAEIGDTFLYRGEDTLLSRAAWIDGLGLAVKTATIFPSAPRLNGAVTLFSDKDGTLEAVIDFHLVTKWKTAADSLLASLRLARPNSRNILIVGAGSVAGAMIEAYTAGFPGATFTIWNRSAARAGVLAERSGARVMTNLEQAVHAADIICSATMVTEPLIRGDWLQPGQHLDLIGAYRPDMREADDRALQRSRIFVDSSNTTLDHIGELKIPLQSGAIRREDIVSDFYNLSAFRRDPSDITLFKNGGGAHLDLMVSRYILDAWGSR